MLVQIKTNINSVTFGEAKSSLKENRNLTVGNLTSLFKIASVWGSFGVFHCSVIICMVFYILMRFSASTYSSHKLWFPLFESVLGGPLTSGCLSRSKAAKQPQTVTFPPPWLTVGMRVFSWKHTFSMPITVMAKQLLSFFVQSTSLPTCTLFLCSKSSPHIHVTFLLSFCNYIYTLTQAVTRDLVLRQKLSSQADRCAQQISPE